MPGNGVALGVKTAEDEIFLIGYNCIPMLAAGDAEHMDILELEEGEFRDGKWIRGRRLNGDEAATCRSLLPGFCGLKSTPYCDE